MVSEMQKAIDINLPKNGDELRWIVENVGKILFEDKWDKIRPIDKNKVKYNPIIFGILQTIHSNKFSTEEKSELINYLFTSSLNILNKTGDD